MESGDFTSDSSIQSAVVTTSEGDKYSEEARNLHVIDAHNKNIVSNQVTFSDKQDSEIQSMCLDESLPQPNDWQMPDKINLDSSGLR